MPPETGLRIPQDKRFVLSTARVPAELVVDPPPGALRDAEGALLLDLLVEDGRIAALFPAGAAPDVAGRVALEGRHLWPAFIDMIGGFMDYEYRPADMALLNEDPKFPGAKAFPKAFTFNDQFPVMRAPFKGWALANSSRMAIRPASSPWLPAFG